MTKSDDSENIIQQLQAENNLLRSDLVNLKKNTITNSSTTDQDDTRRALLHMLRDVEANQSKIEKAKREWSDTAVP